MRKRFQKGSLQKVRGEWVARWRQDGERKARKLGRVSRVTKHTIDVNQNVYTITSLKRRREAVNTLENAVGA